MLPQTGLVFGVFDGLHEGHKFFLSQAKGRCGKLVVALTRDEVAHMLKGRYPKYSFSERLEALRSYDPDLALLSGDESPGSWNILNKIRPDVVYLGHDQHALAPELEKQGIPFEYIGAFEPERYKSSILNK